MNEVGKEAGGREYPALGHVSKLQLLLLLLSHQVMSDSATPWTGAGQTPLPVDFPRQEYQGVLPLPKKDTYILMFIAALFTIAKTGKYLKVH